MTTVPDRPNVLFITTDQHRFDAAGFMGHPDARTPHLDRLAASGAVFERCYVTNPVCMPSRATLLTGQFPDAHGVRRNGIEVPDVPWGIGRTFRAAGYRTGLFGKTHFAPLRRDFGPETPFHDWRVGETYYGFEERAITHDLKDFVSDVPTAYGVDPARRTAPLNFTHDDYLDWMRAEHPDTWRLAVREGLADGAAPVAPELWTSVLPAELHQSHWIVDQATAYIDRHANEPWLAWCSFVDPHHPFNAPAPWRDLYDAERLTPPAMREGELEQRSRFHQERSAQQRPVWERHWREYRAQYYGMISLIDDQIGRLLDHLARTGAADRTLVIFTADHGELLGDHGLSRKGLFHYEPLIRVPLVIAWPGRIPVGQREAGIVQSVDLPPTMLAAAGIDAPWQLRGISLLPWCSGDGDGSPRSRALVTNGGEGPVYDPWPELRTLVTDRWKLQHYVGEEHIELDDLQDDPNELCPRDPAAHPARVTSLLRQIVDAGAAASVTRPQTGRW